MWHNSACGEVGKEQKAVQGRAGKGGVSDSQILNHLPELAPVAPELEILGSTIGAMQQQGYTDRSHLSYSPKWRLHGAVHWMQQSSYWHPCTLSVATT